jgi:hypothetical protein
VLVPVLAPEQVLQVPVPLAPEQELVPVLASAAQPACSRQPW